MRNITRCDICGKEEHTDKPRIPKDFVWINGLDFCGKCRIKYRREHNKLLRRLIKEGEE